MTTQTQELNETALKHEVAFYPVEAARIKIETEEDHEMACEFLATVREKIKAIP